ncbi:N(G),N(G)-dimethylarginine dimethylaminohydrolase [Lentzea sp. NBRC 105346]|uniref:dimethylargininase n=1 Tax=Lentzea sp. NBRC 105346 TaxID=3032205 RepID=UPI0024A0CA19|nr:dimethylargininase [Lentzea sp. NBRC 105346]GLZ32537.1 N(G),N(G)-dimethylarginine dimethylaminohydrolase [Lentzea sp. NBRC 105346]
MIALVRKPSPRLAEGIVTHIDRTPVDVDLAMRQHDAYRQALSDAGWAVVEVPSADDCPDSVFIEDALVVVGELAILTRPGAPERRGEIAGAEQAARELGLEIARIEEPGTLDGGDVLQVGDTIYVGRGGRTNAEGIRQLRKLTGKTVVPVKLTDVLHLKSAITALPDGTFLAQQNPGVFPVVREVEEEAGSHVVLLGADEVLISASAPKTAAELEDLGFRTRIVDISEFEKLEGCVTCLSVLVEAR